MILIFQTSWIHINMETKRSCQLTASLCLLVNLQFEKKSLLEIKTEMKKLSSLYWYKCRPLKETYEYKTKFTHLSQDWVILRAAVHREQKNDHTAANLKINFKNISRIHFTKRLSNDFYLIQNWLIVKNNFLLNNF